MVMVYLYNSPVLAAAPMAFLLCRTSRITIMVVRRRLSEKVTEKYVRPEWNDGSAVTGSAGSPVS